MHSCTDIQWFSWFLWSVYSTSFVSCPTFKPPDVEKQSSFLVFMNDNYCNRIYKKNHSSTLPFYLWLLLPFVYHLLKMTVLLVWSYTEKQKYGIYIVFIKTFNWPFAFLKCFFLHLKIYFPRVHDIHAMIYMYLMMAWNFMYNNCRNISANKLIVESQLKRSF